MRRKMMVSALLLAGFGLAAGLLFLSGRTEPTAARTLPLGEAERYLLEAARAGDEALVRGLVAAGTPVEARDERGFTPLILAAYHGHAETVEALLQLGADACRGDSRGNTALMGAAFKGHARIAARLATEPCAVDQQNALGQTALMFSSLFGRGEVSSLLQGKGASPALRDAAGRSADDWAATQTAPLAPTVSANPPPAG